MEALACAFGVSNVAVLHRVSDLHSVGASDSEQVALAQGLLADSETRVVYAQAPGELSAAMPSCSHSPSTETDLLPQLRRGVALWKVGQRSFLVQHRLSAMERRMVDTDGAMGDRRDEFTRGRAVPLAVVGVLVSAVSLPRPGSGADGAGLQAGRREPAGRAGVDLRPLHGAEPGSRRPARVGSWPVFCGRCRVAAERAQSVVVVGPTQSGKTTCLAVPAIAAWDGPVVAASVKSDLLRHTLGTRSGLKDRCGASTRPAPPGCGRASGPP